MEVDLDKKVWGHKHKCRVGVIQNDAPSTLARWSSFFLFDILWTFLLLRLKYFVSYSRPVQGISSVPDALARAVLCLELLGNFNTRLALSLQFSKKSRIFQLLRAWRTWNVGSLILALVDEVSCITCIRANSSSKGNTNDLFASTSGKWSKKLHVADLWIAYEGHISTFQTTVQSCSWGNEQVNVGNWQVYIEHIISLAFFFF